MGVLGWKEQRSGCGKAAECALARGFVKSSELFRFLRSLSNGQRRSNGCQKVTTAADERTRRVRSILCAAGLSGAERSKIQERERFAGHRQQGDLVERSKDRQCQITCMIGLARLESSPERMT
jgi:hypothetical protein